jgi:NMD protein affecting ribosome stability and mRNA decay
MLWVVSQNCLKCGKKRKTTIFLLPTSPVKKTKKGISFSYTPSVDLCRKCGKELIEYINKWFEEKK